MTITIDWFISFQSINFPNEQGVNKDTALMLQRDGINSFQSINFPNEQGDQLISNMVIPVSRFQSINFPNEQGVWILSVRIYRGGISRVSNQLISLTSRELLKVGDIVNHPVVSNQLISLTSREYEQLKFKFSESYSASSLEFPIN